MKLFFHVVSLLVNPNHSANVLSVCVCSLFCFWNRAAWERIINQIPASLRASYCSTLTVASQAVCAAYERRTASPLCNAPTKYLTGRERTTSQTAGDPSRHDKAVTFSARFSVSLINTQAGADGTSYRIYRISNPGLLPPTWPYVCF